MLRTKQQLEFEMTVAINQLQTLIETTNSWIEIISEDGYNSFAWRNHFKDELKQYLKVLEDFKGLLTDYT